MPFVNADRELASFDWSGYDKIVIGAGAAGILLALKLAEKGRRVLVIESGHFDQDDNRQQLNQIEESGKPLGDPLWVRKRVIGGTTTAWGGQSLPFTAIDFARRDWVEDSGWPIAFEDLGRYYSIADAFMGIDDLNYDTDIAALLKFILPNFDDQVIYYHYSKWAREPNLFKLHKTKLKEKVTILYNCEFLRIDLGENGRVESVEVGNFRGDRRLGPVVDLIVAAGGIETNRILLLNDHQRTSGLGNQSGWLGRGFMEHPSLDAGHVETSDMYRLQAALGTRVKNRRQYGVRMSASPSWQTRHRLLNISASMLWFYGIKDIGPLSELRMFAREPSLGRLMRIAGRGREVSQGLWALASQGFVYKVGARGRLAFMCEQAPSANSYIALSEKRDQFGRRQALLNWQVGFDTWETVVRFGEALAAQIPRAGLGEVKLFEHLRLDEPDWERHVHDVNHHMGGVRMSATPEGGVVDPDLRVWGVPNLYACSTAVFPTSSHSNPTLTLLALGARLAEQLAT